MAKTKLEIDSADAKADHADAPAVITTHLIVTVRPPLTTFYRAGIGFSTAPQELAIDTLTAAQIEAIESEPNLIVATRELAE